MYLAYVSCKRNLHTHNGGISTLFLLYPVILNICLGQHGWATQCSWSAFFAVPLTWSGNKGNLPLPVCNMHILNKYSNPPGRPLPSGNAKISPFTLWRKSPVQRCKVQLQDTATERVCSNLISDQSYALQNSSAPCEWPTLQDWNPLTYRTTWNSTK